MTKHVHAESMRLYAEDALETEKPWERWEFKHQFSDGWRPCCDECRWLGDVEYRRKRIPLCQIEGRDVFVGDKLWHKELGCEVTVKSLRAPATCLVDSKNGSNWAATTTKLARTEPPKTKIVYQWAHPSGKLWVVPVWFYETEKEFRETRGVHDDVPVRRLDWTALEVPA